MKSALLVVGLSGLMASALPVDTSVAFASVEKRGLYGDTANELGLCRSITIIYARGTLESGNIGLLAGPPFFDALEVAIGSGTFGVQGVPYSANIFGYLEGGDAQGSQTLAALTEQAATQCPHTKIILSGYSQGAQLVHNGANLLSPQIAARVVGVVLFGDPFDGQPIKNISPNIVKTYCFSWDLICKDTIFVDPAHLSYSIDAIPAAEWVETLLGY